MTPYDNGNYTCVPSYAIPDWTRVEILNGNIPVKFCWRLEEGEMVNDV